MRKLSYDDTLQVLDSWYGRAVTVSILGEGSKWYATKLAGQLPKRRDIDLEWLADDLLHRAGSDRQSDPRRRSPRIARGIWQSRDDSRPRRPECDRFVAQIHRSSAGHSLPLALGGYS